MFRRRRTSVLVVVLAMTPGACMQWSRRPHPAPEQDHFLAGRVRVTRADGSAVLLDSVTVGRDSVVGREVSAARGRVAIPATEVRRVESRRVSPFATAAVVVLTVAAAFVAWGVSTITSIVD